MFGQAADDRRPGHVRVAALFDQHPAADRDDRRRDGVGGLHDPGQSREGLIPRPGPEPDRPVNHGSGGVPHVVERAVPARLVKEYVERLLKGHW